MKKLIAAITVAMITIGFASNAEAQPEKSIVIIDTGIDTSIPQLSNSVIQEVCLALVGCKTTEGPGSAFMPAKSGFEHGTIMSLVANQVNPSAKIIFIRIWQASRNGSLSTMSETEFTNVMTKALDWVVANKEKYNIVSVSASLGGNKNYKSGADYCPIKPTHSGMISNIDKLMTMGVPTIFASGNNLDRSRINFPACIGQSVAVSGTDKDNVILIEANTAPQVDFFVLGVYNTVVKNARGTSASAAAFSAYWAKNYRGSFQSTYDYMKSISKPTKNAYVSTTSFVDVLN